ncbi:MAG: FHA domain-containing protein [Myxococcota bacterium]
MLHPSEEEAEARRLRDEERQRQSARSVEGVVDLDVLRGWGEVRDASLRSEHILPAMARLVLLHGQEEIGLHGPKLVLGRLNAQFGPVDTLMSELFDHERYRIGAPHVHLSIDEREEWSLRVLTADSPTHLNDLLLPLGGRPHKIKSGDILRLDTNAFRFEVCEEISLSRWTNAFQDILTTERRPALLLKRDGGLCGPRLGMSQRKLYTVGRSFPRLRRLPHTMSAPPLDWDLSGLFEHERKHVAYRHIALRPLNDQDWAVAPLSRRHRVFVNRVEISEVTPLEPGDEIGLNTILLHYHNPRADQPSSTHTIRLPIASDWSQEDTKSIDREDLDRELEHDANTEDG